MILLQHQFLFLLLIYFVLRKEIHQLMVLLIDYPKDWQAEICIKKRLFMSFFSDKLRTVPRVAA
jgi:hypothetical protein